jgi:hypothetical protein
MAEFVMIPKDKLIGWKVEAGQIFDEFNPVDLDTIRLWKLVSDILLEMECFVLKPKLEEKEK